VGPHGSSIGEWDAPEAAPGVSAGGLATAKLSGRTGTVGEADARGGWLAADCEAVFGAGERRTGLGPVGYSGTRAAAEAEGAAEPAAEGAEPKAEGGAKPDNMDVD